MKNSSKYMLKFLLPTIGFAALVGTSGYINEKKFERGVPFESVGTFDANNDGIKDYLIVVEPAAPPIMSHDKYQALAYYEGQNVTNENGKLLAHGPALYIPAALFKPHTDAKGIPYSVIVSDMGKDSNGFHTLKVSQPTEDFPVSIDQVIKFR